MNFVFGGYLSWLYWSRVCIDLLLFFFLVGIKDKNNARDTNYFTKFLQTADVVSDYW